MCVVEKLVRDIYLISQSCCPMPLTCVIFQKFIRHGKGDHELCTVGKSPKENIYILLKYDIYTSDNVQLVPVKENIT